MIQHKKAHDSIFSTWDNAIRSKLPELYRASRLELLGHISAMCLSWKFGDKIKASTLFSDHEKKIITEHGNQFRDMRNNCSNSMTRRTLLSGVIVRIGKLLYLSSLTCEESFWNQILERKKAAIKDFQAFKDAHISDISKIKLIDCSGDFLN
jgi:hypothetical protein